MKTREERAKEIIEKWREYAASEMRANDCDTDELLEDYVGILEDLIAQALPDLPSDREIRLAAREDAKGMRDDDSQSECYAGAVTGFEAGARWMRERIAGRDKG